MIRRLWHSLLVRLGLRKPAEITPAMIANTALKYLHRQQIAAMSVPPRMLISKFDFTPEMEEQLKRQAGYITVSRSARVQWLPNLPRSANEPEAHIWKMLSHRSKLRNWADWMPIQRDLMHG